MHLQVVKDDCDDSAGHKRDCDDTATRESDRDDTRFNRNESCSETMRFVSDDIAQTTILQICNAVRRWLQLSSFDKNLTINLRKLLPDLESKVDPTNHVLFPSWKNDRKVRGKSKIPLRDLGRCPEPRSLPSARLRAHPPLQPRHWEISEDKIMLLL